MAFTHMADWTDQWEHNRREAEMNSLMDSGWSLATAERCANRARELLWDLVTALAETETRPSDFFDRQRLVELQEVARRATAGRK